MGKSPHELVRAFLDLELFFMLSRKRMYLKISLSMLKYHSSTVYSHYIELKKITNTFKLHLTYTKTNNHEKNTTYCNRINNNDITSAGHPF